MIKLFSSTDNLFTSNGDKVIIPTKAKVHKEDTGAILGQVVATLGTILAIVAFLLLIFKKGK